MLFLVNYSKKGTQFEDQVLVMKVEDVNPQASAPVKTIDKKCTREEYSTWFRNLNKRGKR